MVKKTALFIIALGLGLAVVVSDRHRHRPDGPFAEGCLFCHGNVSDPDPSHRVEALGCHSCHLGNPYALDKDRAHVSVVPNPGDLGIVDRTCGQTGCHPDIAPRVKNSIMATNQGILNTIQYHWLEIRDAGTSVEDLMAESPPANIAIGHFRKMCGGCHLWKERGDRPGEIGFRGGGCTDCHVPDREWKGITVSARWEHPIMTTRIPSHNCIKCHNRSGRIGLSYLGRYESAGYGTPHEDGGLNQRRLSGRRFFIHIQPDIHFKRAGMECIDCHTAVGLMGDGKRYDRMAEQVDITCEACHLPMLSSEKGSDPLANRLSSLNKNIPSPKGARVGVSRKGTPIYNLQQRGNKILFFRKGDGRSLTLGKPFTQSAYHTLPGHERLSCQACHSRSMPQCYGCHLDYHGMGNQRDWISGDVTPGRWQEKRSYIRFHKPALGVDSDNQIYPITPCQVVGRLSDASRPAGNLRSFRIFTVSAFDPHTTAGGARGCLECHADPKTLGLGEGILQRKEGEWIFRPTHDGGDWDGEIPFPWDGYTNLSGERVQKPYRTGDRPFNGKELEKILLVGACVGCHDRWDDPVYKNFPESRNRFLTDPRIPCKR